ncbi:MAG: hypothetical protein AB7U20_21430 [Planctomycetaceae bacterium]
MATKSRRKKQEAQRRERIRRKQQQQKSASAWKAGARQSQRIAAQLPRAWPGEAAEDVAIFDDAALASLSPELASQVASIRTALQAVCESRDEDALQEVSGIPRSSPLSQWRLLIRGIIDWMADDSAAAEAWKRLDPERRPGRIATVMTAAPRTDLDSLSPTESNAGPADSAPGNWPSRLDERLLYHAKLLRRLRIDRTSLRIAEAGANAPEEAKELTLGPKKIGWLQTFAKEYRSSEPELVAALEQVALGRAYTQDYSDIFETATRTFVGPRHDRRNSLLTFFYHMRFADDRRTDRTAQRFLDQYLTRDLPQNPELSEPVRSAIASQIHLNEATMLIEPAGQGMFSFAFRTREDDKAVKRHLQAAVRAYPANREAYRAHTQWLESKLDNERLTKGQRAPLERQLAEVMQDWSAGLPDDVEPRLWLVDYLLENEQTQQAEPHVSWLAAARQDNPRVRAAPWKWQLLEAMRLCRRKTWLPEVPGRLDEAASQWPKWLSPQWLPYLRAALSLRSGESAEFEQQRQEICAESGIAKDSLADACMMLGAAQRMRVGAAELKLLRKPVDEALQNLGTLPYEELLCTAGFFWDLQRTRLLYPAYRMHGGKLLKQLYSRWERDSALVLKHVDDRQLHGAVFACSEHRFWSNGYELSLPAWYSKPSVRQHPMFAAAQINAFLKLRRHWSNDRYKPCGPLLRQAAQTERDPYYRHWFVSLADELDEDLAREASSPFGFRFDVFSRMFGAAEEIDDEDDLLDFDPDCDCPDCRANRRAYEASRRQR